MMVDKMISRTYDKETNTVFQHFGRTEYFYLFNLENDKEFYIDLANTKKRYKIWI